MDLKEGAVFALANAIRESDWLKELIRRYEVKLAAIEEEVLADQEPTISLEHIKDILASPVTDWLGEAY